jgi:magnesium-protoporphyrin O-methyltransferase
MFSPRAARRSLQRYRARGLDEIERRMIESAAGSGVEGTRVLEIGGGIGRLLVELLGAGADRGEVVELVSSWEPYARELARERGLAERTSFRVVDVLEEADGVDPADVVILNRVVCCSPDGVALAGQAARLTRQVLVLSFPRDVVWLRVGVRMLNLGFRLMGRAFRVFAHSPAALEAAAEDAGLRLAECGHGAAWEYMTFRRAA